MLFRSDDLSMRIDNGSSAEKKKLELRKMQMFSNALFVTENIIMILLFYFSQSPPYLVRSTRHGLRRFICSSWSHNESDSFLLLNERIKYSRNSRELPTYTARVGGTPRGGGYVWNFWVRCAAGSLEPLTFTRASSAEFCYPIVE